MGMCAERCRIKKTALHAEMRKRRHSVSKSPFVDLSFIRIRDSDECGFSGRKIHRRVDFPQEMLLRRQHIRARRFDCRPLLCFFFSAFSSPALLHQKRPLLRPFLTGWAAVIVREAGMAGGWQACRACLRPAEPPVRACASPARSFPRRRCWSPEYPPRSARQC